MPELPDVTVYVERLRAIVGDRVIEGIRLGSPFLVRSFEPPLDVAKEKRVTGVRRMGKRVVFELEDELFLVLHLMIAGRLHFRERGAKLAKKFGLLALDFAHGSLVLTEAGSKRRASLYVVRGERSLAEFDRGGLEPIGSSLADFEQALRSESHTIKRALTDPTLFSGIGNAYSDEILHRARLSPMKLTGALERGELERLHAACIEVLVEWTERLRAEAGEGFPEKVTAFRAEMAVHGRYGKPCPVCGSPVQRIVHASNEINYCPRCQTGGRLLADRALSRLLKRDFPRTLEELEEHKRQRSE
ncbi:MAG TPA: DNA-formamidopyrimidine glycosylase family protein [Polyangiaceae bacterium]